jgi:PAS domain S-box-containing protein
MKGKYLMNADKNATPAVQLKSCLVTPPCNCIDTLAALLDGIPVASLMIDSNENVVIWNKACETLTGLPREEMLNMPLTSDFLLINQMDAKRGTNSKDFVTSSLVQNGFEVTHEMVLRGEKRSIFVTVTDVYDHLENRIGVLQTLQDMTDKRQLLNQLYQAQKMESLGSLVAGIAHEINNPVNLVLYNLPLLEKIFADVLPVLQTNAVHEPDKRYGGLPYPFLNDNLMALISDMELAAKRIAHIVSGLKSFSKFSSSTEKKPFQLNQAIDNAIRLSQTTLRKQNIQLNLKLAEDIPLFVGNQQNIEQVILNLLINSAQSIEHEQGRISISTSCQKNGHIVMTVSDNGRGIRREIADKLFDPFVTDRQASGGTGLGLSVSYNIISAHDGTISFKSQEGSDTTFQVILPTDSRKKIHRILIVDDDPLIRELLRDILMSRRAYSIEEASNGIEACIRLGSHRPDMMVLDLFMPEMNGLDVCRVIRNDTELSDVKLMVITGHEGHADLNEISQMGMVEILYKPFDLNDFLKRVDNILME